MRDNTLLTSLRQTTVPSHRPCLPGDQVDWPPVDLLHSLGASNTMLNTPPPLSLYPNPISKETPFQTRSHLPPELQVGYPPADRLYSLSDASPQHYPQIPLPSWSQCPSLQLWWRLPAGLETIQATRSPPPQLRWRPSAQTPIQQ